MLDIIERCKSLRDINKDNHNIMRDLNDSLNIIMMTKCPLPIVHPQIYRLNIVF